MSNTNNPTDIIGGFWVAFKLLMRCRFRVGSGSYLAWRRETAFGKVDAFPRLTNSRKRRAVLAWISWASRQQREVAKYHNNA